MPYLYEASFQGTVIVQNSYRAQTNSKASFSLDFSIGVNDETEKTSEQLVSWRIGRLKNDKTLPLFADLWNSALERRTNDLAYSILLPSDQILTISKDGTRSYLGTVLELALPSVNVTARSKIESYAFESTSADNSPLNYLVKISGWDFFGQEPPDDLGPLPFIGRDDIISQIYSSYEEKNRQKQPTLFWIQSTEILSGRAFEAASPLVNATGIYQLNLRRGVMEKAYISVQAVIAAPLENRGAQANWNIKIDGTFTLEEKK